MTWSLRLSGFHMPCGPAPYAIRFGFNRASIFVLLETDPVNAAGQQSSQHQSALLPSEHNEYWTAKSQLPGAGAMKTMVTGNACSKAKAACTMQHASLSMMQGCQAGSLSSLEGNQPQLLYCRTWHCQRMTVQGSAAHGMAGKRRYVRQAEPGWTGWFWRELQPWRQCTFSRHAREEAFWAFGGIWWGAGLSFCAILRSSLRTMAERAGLTALLCTRGRRPFMRQSVAYCCPFPYN